MRALYFPYIRIKVEFGIEKGLVLKSILVDNKINKMRMNDFRLYFGLLLK